MPRTKKGTQWFEASVNGGILILQGVKAAAKLAPVPYLQQAADAALVIVNTVQAVRDNKAAFKGLAEDAAGIIYAIWRSYEQSDDQKGWPGDKLKDAIRDLLKSLVSIEEFVEDQLDRNMASRLLYYMADQDKVKKYRERLQQAVNAFGVSADLEMHEALRGIQTVLKEMRDESRKPTQAVGKGKKKPTSESEALKIKGGGYLELEEGKRERSLTPIPSPIASHSATRKTEVNIESDTDDSDAQDPPPRPPPPRRKRNAKKSANPTNVRPPNDSQETDTDTDTDADASPPAAPGGGGSPAPYHSNPYAPYPQYLNAGGMYPSPPTPHLSPHGQFPYYSGYPNGHFGALAGTHITNSNSGNVSNMTMSNVGNDNSVRVTGKAKRRRS